MTTWHGMRIGRGREFSRTRILAGSGIDKLDKALARARHFLQLVRSPEYSDWCQGAQTMVQTATDATKSVATVICKSKLSELVKASAQIAMGTLCEQHDELKTYYRDGSTKLVWEDKVALAKGSIATWNSQGSMDAAVAFQRARRDRDGER